MLMGVSDRWNSAACHIWYLEFGWNQNPSDLRSSQMKGGERIMGIFVTCWNKKKESSSIATYGVCFELRKVSASNTTSQ